MSGDHYVLSVWFSIAKHQFELNEPCCCNDCNGVFIFTTLSLGRIVESGTTKQYLRAKYSELFSCRKKTIDLNESVGINFNNIYRKIIYWEMCTIQTAIYLLYTNNLNIPLSP